MTETYDVAIMGSGASGGWVAKQLTEAGLRASDYLVEQLKTMRSLAMGECAREESKCKTWALRDGRS